MGLGSSNNQSGGHAPLSEINVTPLVDVMLVLLIIFMVTAPLTQSGMQVDLPNAETPSISAADDKVKVSVASEQTAAGKNIVVMIDAERCTLANLDERIHANRKLMQDKEAYLLGDENVPYGTVVRVMATLRNAGISKIGIVTDPVSSH